MLKQRWCRGCGQHLLPSPIPILGLCPVQPRWRHCSYGFCARSQPGDEILVFGAMANVCLGPRAPQCLEGAQAGVLGDGCLLWGMGCSRMQPRLRGLGCGGT